MQRQESDKLKARALGVVMTSNLSPADHIACTTSKAYVFPVGLYRKGFTFLETPIPQLEQLFSLQPLQQRRVICDMFFLFKLIKGLVDCSALLAKIDFNVPRGTRSHSIFSQRFSPKSYAHNCRVARLQTLGSMVSGSVDFFHVGSQHSRTLYMLLPSDRMLSSLRTCYKQPFLINGVLICAYSDGC
ncbi:hypothetical protein J6590_103939 [Homalodisca vitripennis]|nr:hypothetical protein J6590_103939 [Homalodisca vitripennis]